MKVLRVIATMDPAAGGPCQGIRNSIPELAKLGCETEVVCLDDPDEEYEIEDSFPVHRLGRGRGPWSMSKDLTPWLMTHIGDYDVVILHGLWQYPSFAVVKAIKNIRRTNALKTPRFFVMPHGMLDPWFQRDPSRRLKAIRNWVVWKAVECNTIEQADGLLFTCQRELELARGTFRPYRPRKELNIGYGVPEPFPRTPGMDMAFRAVVPYLSNRPYLLFLSRIHPKKGVDLLIDAYLDVIRNASCDTPSRTGLLLETGREETGWNVADIPDLVIAGPIDSAYAQSMIELARGNPHIHFPGMLTGDAKWGAFHGCDVFVLPSHQENFGIAVVEALSCGKPVLISDQVNICYEIDRDHAGIIRPDTAEGTLSLLKNYLSKTPTERRVMSEAAIGCFQRNFQVASAAAKMFHTLGDEPLAIQIPLADQGK